MRNQTFNKSLQIDFTDDAWKKLEELKRTILKMMGSRVELLRQAPHLIGLLEWFWNNKKEFEAWTIVNEMEKKIVF